MDSITGDMSGSRIDPRTGVVQVRDTAHAWFTTRPKHMPAKSEAAGHPVYEDITMVNVQQPGDMNPVTREYRPGDERRWPEAWAAYQEGRKAPVDGTPVSILFPASPAMVHNLEGVGVHTIEQLASVTDTGLGNIPMGLTLRDKAKAFLDARDGADGFNKLQAQLERKDEQMRSMQMQMTEMQSQLATIAAQRESDPGNAVSVTPLSLSPEQIAQIAALIQPAVATPDKSAPKRAINPTMRAET